MIGGAVAALLLVAAGQTALAASALPVKACINMGGSLEGDDNAWDGKRIDAGDFATIRAAGFDTVRLPANFSAHSMPDSPHTLDPAFLARVAQVVDWANGAGLTVILDSHHFEALHADPAGNRAWLAALWDQIARRLADRPRAHLWFEIDNEPHGALTNANLTRTLGPALIAIRLSNPDRPVIIGGGDWSGVDSLTTLPLPADPNVWPSFHYYQPMEFTHQGASWISPHYPLGRVWGSTADKAQLAKNAARVRAFIAATGKVPVLGETGAVDLAPPERRAAYLGAVRRAFAPMGVGVCAWAYTNTFPLHDRTTRRWLPGMLAAMGLTPGK